MLGFSDNNLVGTMLVLLGGIFGEVVVLTMAIVGVLRLMFIGDGASSWLESSVVVVVCNSLVLSLWPKWWNIDGVLIESSIN